ncbi:MAG: hemolysin family protein [Candidatus Muirbacterium halophilum]|nr:hemolysin family protein [Candidatus Muirbacterium halophilum]MCK9474908.1 hemolysin family protein [Candidatus Muirbacterium halophilum]
MISFWIVITLLMLVLSGFFSGLETGMVSLNRISLKKKNDNGEKNAEFVNSVVSNIEQFLTIILIGNNIVNIGISIIATNVFLPIFINEFGNKYGSIILSGLVITPIILLFGEILPKEIFRQKADTLVYKCSLPANIAYYIFIIPAKMMNFFIQFIMPQFQKEGLLESKDEIEHLISVSDKSGALEPGQKKMMEGIFDLAATSVKEIMTPRINIVAVPVDTDYEYLISTVERHGYSRIPVYADNIDDIKGFVFALDIVHDERETPRNTLKQYVREIKFVPETKKIDELFDEMKKSKEQIRVVIDEYGQVSGIVTLEDIIEEIVGEIHDEYDFDVVFEKRNKDGSILIDAVYSVEELNDKYNLNIPVDEDYETLGGFLENITGEIPREKQEIVWNGSVFTIISKNNNSIGTVLMNIIDSDEDNNAEEED